METHSEIEPFSFSAAKWPTQAFAWFSRIFLQS